MRVGALATAAAAMATMCSEPAAAGGCEPTYRLYRTWVPGTGLPGRVHVATFDSCEHGGQNPDPITGTVGYNETNCEIARNLFQTQPGVRVTYWCERWTADE
jgi:hypothetical protein